MLAVTVDEQIAAYANRKAALRRQVSGAGDEALTLFAADKLSRLGELRRKTAVQSRGQRHAGSAPRVACSPPDELSALLGAARGTSARIASPAGTPRRGRALPCERAMPGGTR
jgi:hypothetical protein